MHGTLNVFNYEGEGNLIVIQVKLILSVTAIVPIRGLVEGSHQYFLIEKFAQKWPQTQINGIPQSEL